jgi:AraC family transcriptional regulator
MSGNIIINSPSIIHEPVNKIFQVYQNYHSTGEDPKAKILDRHLIGLTTNQPYYLKLKHDTDKLTKIEYQVGELMIFSAGVSHWASWQNSSGIFLSIDDKLFDYYSKKFLDNQIIQLKSNLKIQDSLLSELLRSIVNVYHNEGEIAKLYLESISTTLVLHLINYYSDFKFINKLELGGLNLQKLSLVKDYIKNNLNEDITIKKLANLLELSEYHFIRTFKKSMGMSPYQYVLKERLKKAIEMIRERKETLVQIAISCGFSSQSQMNTMLKKHFNITPTDIMKSI